MESFSSASFPKKRNAPTEQSAENGRKTNKKLILTPNKIGDSMSSDILDEVEKFTGPRTCPECGYQFPFGKFVKHYIRSYGLSKWPCQSCREVLVCDFIKIQFFWLLGLLPFGLLFGLFAFRYESDVLNVLLLIPFFAFVLGTLYYVRFEKDKKVH